MHRAVDEGVDVEPFSRACPHEEPVDERLAPCEQPYEAQDPQCVLLPTLDRPQRLFPTHQIAQRRVAHIRDRAAERGRRLDRAEAEEHRIRARVSRVLRRAQRLGAVLEQQQPVPVAEGNRRVERGASSEEVRHDERASLLGQRALEEVAPRLKRVEVEVDRHRNQAVPADDASHVGMGDRRHEHFAAFFQRERLEQ